MYLHGTSRVNEKGHLEIGGCDVTDLAAEYGTPLYVYDEALIRSKCRAFVDAFRESGFSFQVAYASKAFCTMAMCKLIEEEGLSLDVVSGENCSRLSRLASQWSVSTFMAITSP